MNHNNELSDTDCLMEEVYISDQFKKIENEFFYRYLLLLLGECEKSDTDELNVTKNKTDKHEDYIQLSEALTEQEYFNLVSRLECEGYTCLELRFVGNYVFLTVRTSTGEVFKFIISNFKEEGFTMAEFDGGDAGNVSGVDSVDAGYVGDGGDSMDTGYVGDSVDGIDAGYVGDGADDVDAGYVGDGADDADASYVGDDVDSGDVGYVGDDVDSGDPGYDGDDIEGDDESNEEADDPDEGSDEGDKEIDDPAVEVDADDESGDKSDSDEEDNSEDDEEKADNEEDEEQSDDEKDEEKSEDEVDPEVRKEIEENSDYSSEVNDYIKSVEELKIYQDAGLHEEDVDGKICLVRDDIDMNQVDEFGSTNAELMEDGYAPYDKNGHKIELHHIGQKDDSPLAELSFSEHHLGNNYSILHDTNKESEIDRKKFKDERSEHWKSRSKS